MDERLLPRELIEDCVLSESFYQAMMAKLREEIDLDFWTRTSPEADTPHIVEG
jgi:hypothetical protein